jgi:hypothetical protein
MLDPLRKHTSLGIVLLLAACLPAAEPRPIQEASGSRTDAPHVAALIARLGSTRFDEREAATRALEALGPEALELLRKALPSRDAEVRRRAGQLVQKIEWRLASDRALEPTRLRLVYRDTPVRVAAADLARKTGFLIQLEGGRTKLAERRLTLDTGDATLWEALAEFCHQAGLAEGGFRPGASLEDRYRSDLRESRVITLGDVSGEGADRQERQLFLKDGSAQALPTYQAGALRIRALPPDTPLAGPSKAEGETLFGLEVRLEPRLLLQSVLALRIDRAVDDRGQTLTPSEALVATAASSGVGTEVLIFWNGFSELPSNLPSGAGQVPVRLRLPDRPSRRLKELQGSIALQVQTPPEPLVTVDRLLEAVGQTVQGDDGSSVRLTEVRREGDGQVLLQVEVAPAPRDLFFDGLPVRIVMTNRGPRRGPVQGMLVPPVVGAGQLTLLDARGGKVPLADGTIPAVSASGKGWEFILAYRPGPGQGEPSRLIYTGRRSATVEVPFTLKDVPLP